MQFEKFLIITILFIKIQATSISFYSVCFSLWEVQQNKTIILSKTKPGETNFINK